MSLRSAFAAQAVAALIVAAVALAVAVQPVFLQPLWAAGLQPWLQAFLAVTAAGHLAAAAAGFRWSRRLGLNPWTWAARALVAGSPALWELRLRQQQQGCAHG